MSSLALDQAHQIKTDIDNRESSSGATPFVPRETWFTPDASQDHLLGRRLVSYENVSMAADLERVNWSRIDPRIVHSFDFEDKLIAWLRGTPVSVLAAALDAVPFGLEGLTFTPWQRLGLCVMSCLPFSVTSSISASIEAIRELDVYAGQQRLARAVGMEATFSMRATSFPRCILCDLPTAGGKTAWSCAIASVAVCDRFPQLRAEYRERALHEAVVGLPELPVARLVLIAPTASTFNHFVDAVERLVPVLARAHPHLCFHVWKGMKREHSIAAASAADDCDVFFWVHPVDKRCKILRETPKVSVAASVIDEYSVDAPREKTRTSKAPVLHTVITQATPQALENATTGCSSWLQDVFGGALNGPNRLGRLLGSRCFKEAQLCMEQACKLDLFTMSAFRRHVRDDLRALVPCGFEVVFVRARRVSIASHLVRSSADMVPASLLTVVCRFVPALIPEQSAHLENILQPSLLNVRALREAVTSLPPLASHLPPATPHLSQNTAAQAAAIARLVERIDEFASQCPICLEEDQSQVMMCACCGYCTCQGCWARTARCPFCRSGILTERVAGVEARDAQAIETYPTRVEAAADVITTLTENVSQAHSQLFNLSQVLACAAAHRRRRFLVVVESDSRHTAPTEAEFARITQATGVELHVPRISGAGTRFHEIKKRFDSNDPTPIALVSFMASSLLVGTDLTFVDCVITVGAIHAALLTQAIGRVFRPRASRDNALPILIARVYS